MDPLIKSTNPRTTRACTPVADAVDQAIADTQELPSASFKIFTGLLKAFEGPDGSMRLRGVASSTTRDLHGDVMTESALQDMEKDANDNLTIFLNHSYNVPEDVAGSVVMAKMTRRGVDGDGNPNYDLDYEIVIDQENPRAVKAYRSIKSGVKLGLSIGAMIPDGGATRDKKSGALTISHVKLLETSIVSIPANTRSWIDRSTGASSALLKAWHEKRQEEKLAGEHTLGAPTLTLAGDSYTIRGSLNGLQLSDEPEVGSAAEPTVVDAASAETATPEVSDGVDPDVQDSRVRIIEIDTDDPKGSNDGDSSSQEGDSADPGAEEDEWSGTPTTTASVDPDAQLATQLENMDPGVATLVRGLFGQLQAATAMVAQLSGDLESERAVAKEAVRTRDEVIQQAGLAMSQMETLLQRLADTPMGRKASFKTIQDDLDGIRASGIYSDSFLKIAAGR